MHLKSLTDKSEPPNSCFFLYADRQVIEIDETVTGSLSISGSLFVSRSLDAGQNILLNTAQQGGGYINFNSDEGASGYGFRTSGGTLQFKNVCFNLKASGQKISERGISVRIYIKSHPQGNPIVDIL